MRRDSLNEGFPKLGLFFWGVPIIRTLVFWGLYWGPLLLGNYQIRLTIFRGPYNSDCGLLGGLDWGPPYLWTLPYLNGDIQTTSVGASKSSGLRGVSQRQGIHGHDANRGFQATSPFMCGHPEALSAKP